MTVRMKTKIYKQFLKHIIGRQQIGPFEMLFLRTYVWFRKFDAQGFESVFLKPILHNGRPTQSVISVMRQLNKLSPSRLDALLTPLISIYTKKYKNSRLMSCFVDITYECNLSCAHCVYRDKLNLNIPSMSKTEFKSIVEKLDSNIRVFFLLGGEPFLNREVISTVSEFPDKIFVIFTNGTVLNQSDFDWLESVSNVVLLFSVDGDEEQHIKHKSSGNYETLLCNIQKARSLGIVSGVATVLHDDIIENTSTKFAHFTKTLSDYDVNFWLLLFEQTKASSNTYIQKYNMFSKNKLKAYDIPILNLPYDELLGNYLVCPEGKAFFHIRGDGSYAGCPYATSSAGNIYRDSIETIKQHLNSNENFCPYRKKERFVNVQK